MEPEDVTRPEERDLENLIRRGLARPALPDGGFTARVLGSLAPIPRMAHYQAWLRLSWAGAGFGFLLLAWACSVWWGRELAYPRDAWPVADLQGNAWLYLAFAAALMSCLTAWHATDSAREP
jgi:hypothetical protein